VAYFLSRLSALCWAILQVIFKNTPSIDCIAFGKASAFLLIVGMTSTKSLCYLRTCAVWGWNRFIVAFFTVSWLSVAAATTVTATRSTKALQVETHCSVIIVDARLIPAPLIVAVCNHTLIVIAITYGICKNTLGGDLTFRHGIMAMLGKSLPTFSRALLHDSQISYIMIAGISVIALIWSYIWPNHLPSPLNIAAMAPYFVLVTILTGRVHRNTKLGLYNMDSRQSNDPKTQSFIMFAGSPVVSNVDDYRSDYSTTRRRGSVNSLDFGLVRDI